ncbi:MAG: phosphomethylpyrimidine synthase ThiC [Thermoplasmata archaeon]
MSLMKEAAHRVTDEILAVARSENIEAEKLRKLVASGKVVIPCNPVRQHTLKGIGEGLSIKVNVNIGTSKDHVDLNEEFAKVEVAEKYGADALMDLSTGGDINAIRKEIRKKCNLPMGSVPIYQVGVECARKSAIVNMSEDDIFNSIEAHAKDGIDFMTVHCGVTRESVEKLRQADRVTGVVSRGGAFLVAWILHNQKENPLYENFDYLLELAEKYEFTLSLGDGLRPGSIADASDAPQIQELVILSKLVHRARAKGVQAMVEGPGHVPLNQIEANVRIEKNLTDGAPFYVLGPIVTDVAPGYDHITAAIGGALAGYFGADFLCYVTPSEHLALPTVEDVKEGLIASRIAAHAAEIAKGRGLEWDRKMSEKRYALDWEAMFQLAIDREKAEKYRKNRAPTEQKTCTMCGDVCAMKIVSEFLGKSNIDYC